MSLPGSSLQGLILEHSNSSLIEPLLTNCLVIVLAYMFRRETPVKMRITDGWVVLISEVMGYKLLISVRQIFIDRIFSRKPNYYGR